MSDPIVGIDLGTSNTVVAHANDSGTVQVLADGNGFKIHPSVVSFHPTGGVVVGAAAKQRKVIDPKNTIYSVKRLIGRSFTSTEVQTAKQRAPYQIKEGANQLPLIVTRGGEFAVPEISAIVLDHAKNVATTALKTPVSRAVVTVPASFNDAQRSATATAGSIAGLSVVRVLNEPTAAALAYGSTRNLRETIAVYDFGGGTFDITILKLADQVYEVLGTAGDTFLGGDDLDERLVDRMVEKFLMENRVDLRENDVSMMRLRAVAEQVKIELSRRTRAMVRVDEIAYGPKGKALDLTIEIKREEFVRQVADIIDRTFPVVEEALKLANLEIDFIDDVILVGGTTKIPYVRDQVAKFFAKAPRTDVNPEDAVAVGAGLQAAALERVLGRTRVSTGGSFVNEGTFGGGTDTKTFANEGPTAQVPPSAELLDLLEPTRETPPDNPRKTMLYDAPPERPTGRRAPTRGEHVDRFDDRTPAQASPQQPVIGRITKQNVVAPAPSKTMPPPPPGASKPITRPVPITKPPVPTAAPHQKTITIPPAIPPGPASTLRGIAPLVEDETATGTDFPNLTTDTADIPLALDPPTLPPHAPMRPPTKPPTTQPMPAPKPPAVPTAPSSAPTMIAAPQPLPMMPEPIVIDVTPRSLGIATVAGFCEELIRRNSRVPTEIRKLFTTSRDAQDAVRIIVCQGESRRLDNNTVIADLRLEGLAPRPRGETSIEVTFALDASGILVVRARDAQTGQEQQASLDVVGGIQQGDVAAAREKLQSLRR